MTDDAKKLHPNHEIGGIPIPLYKSHKVVRALRIRHIKTPNAGGDREITFRDPAFNDVSLTLHAELFARYVPLQGDYYVVYDDGYQSFSPWQAFTEGYSLFEPEAKMSRSFNPVVTFSQGDLVRLKGHGPIMTVGSTSRGIDGPPMIGVFWFDADYHLVSQSLPAGVLEKIQDEKKGDG